MWRFSSRFTLKALQLQLGPEIIKIKKAASSKSQATSGKPTPSGGGEKAFYKIVLDIRSGIL
jgi:hypothetical protein